MSDYSGYVSSEYIAECTAPDIVFPNLGITLNNVPQVLFSPFGFDIYLYAVFIVVGIAAAYFMGIWWVKKSGQKVSDYTDLLLLGVPLALVGLRLYYLIFNWGTMVSGRNFFVVFFSFRDGGLAIYGGIIGAVLASIIMSRRKKIPLATMTDTGAPSFVLGQVIGRWGNFFNREAFGSYSDGLFAMRIRVDQSGVRIAEELGEAHAQLIENIYEYQGVRYFQVHPTFLYESFFNLILMAGLMIYRPRKRFNGEITLLYFFGYGVIRFFVESFRTDQMMLFNTGLPLNQVVAVLFAVVSAGLIIAGHIYAYKKKPKPALVSEATPEPAPQPNPQPKPKPKKTKKKKK